MKTKFFTLLFIATLFIANAQQNPIPVNDFTPNYTRLVPTDSWDGNSTTWNLFNYYDWTSQAANIEDANIAVGQGLTAKILLPPGIESIAISHNDEYLAGSQCVRYRVIGEYDLTDNGPTTIPADNDSDWRYGCGSFSLYTASGQGYTRTSAISTEKYVLIAYFNDGNDLGWPLNFQDFGITWRKGELPSDTVLFYNWVNGISTDVNNIKKDNSDFSIYPNPAHNSIVIMNNKLQTTNKKIEILDITGKVVRQFFKHDTQNLRFDVSTLNNGIYFIKIGSHIQKLIKK